MKAGGGSGQSDTNPRAYKTWKTRAQRLIDAEGIKLSTFFFVLSLVRILLDYTRVDAKCKTFYVLVKC